MCKKAAFRGGFLFARKSLNLGMHPSELPQPFADLLWFGGASIKARVWIRAHVKTITGQTATGFPIFGAGYAEYEWEVTNAVLNSPDISIQRPQYPDGELSRLRSIELNIDLDSQNGQLAAAQDSAVLRREDLEQARVIVKAEIGNGNLVDFFSGRVSGMPEEESRTTKLIVTGYLWEALRKPVLYERFSNSPVNDGIVFYNGKAHSQRLSYSNGQLIANSVRIECIGSHFCAYHGAVAFDGGGRPYANIKKEGGKGIDISTFLLGNEIKAGVYTIRFLDPKNYVLTYPDGQTFTSSIYGYTYGAFEIRPSFWIGEDGTDTTFNIYVGPSYIGNPISIAFNLVEKALLDNLGELPNQSAFMDVVKWEEAARRFESYTVHVDATNKDNSVWDGKENSRPLLVAELAQKVLDHVGCSLTMTIDGQISISIPYLDDVPTYPNDTTSVILGDGIKIQSADYLYNTLIVQYGFNGDAYGAKLPPLDLRVDPAAKVVEKTISFPYFKAGIGARLAQWAAETFVRRFLLKQVIITYDVHAGIALLAQVGDRVSIVSETLPLLSKANAEIFKIDKVCGEEKGRFTAQIIQSREGEKATVCTALIGSVEAW